MLPLMLLAPLWPVLPLFPVLLLLGRSWTCSWKRKRMLASPWE